MLKFVRTFFFSIAITILFSCNNNVKTPPADASDFTATALDSKITLSWTNPSDSDFSGVEISCEPNAGTLANPTMLEKGVASLTVYGLENGKEYTFTIKAFDESGNFSSGTTCTGTPVDSSDKTPPADASDFTATAMDSKITLSWTEPTDSDFSGVEISCEPNAGTLTNPITLKKGVAVLMVYGLENGKKYTFTIKAFDESGNISSGVSTSATTKSQVSGIAIEYERQSDIGELEHSVSDDAITFTAPEGYETYKWRLDNKFLESKKETPNEIEIKREALSGGVHSLIVIANGMYSASCTITVKDGENLSDKSVGKVQSTTPTQGLGY